MDLYGVSHGSNIPFIDAHEKPKPSTQKHCRTLQDGAPKIAFSCLISGLTMVYDIYI
jgi:hypothetical protein